ncbi:MAG TPA: toprim domain-containing protein [Candidatus Paceibacterota bacterium]
MDPIERLTNLFVKFPGIGPRQAGRFVQYLLRSSPALRRELTEAIRELSGSVKQCTRCFRFSAADGKVCATCANPARDVFTLAVVASDADLAALERSGTYRGLYFVLGGTISLASEKMEGLRLKQLLDSLPSRIERGLSEVILAFPANPEGDATAMRVREELDRGLPSDTHIKVTALGRGLSTGSELEYADSDTIAQALGNRH